MIRVAIVDDHAAFRSTLRTLLKSDARMQVAAEADSGERFLQLARTTAFDAVCMDISMPGISGIETTRRLAVLRPGVRVIGLSAYDDPLYVEAMLAAGASGYFTKADADATLIEALACATPEHPRFGAGITPPGAVPSRAEAATAAPALQEPASRHLLPAGVREREAAVLSLLAKGWSSAQIGESLAMDPAVVEAHRRNITRRLQPEGRRGRAPHARRAV